MQWSHDTTPRYGQLFCFVLVRTHQHGIARRKDLTKYHRPRRLLPRRVQKHSFKRQLHSVNVVAVAATVQDSLGCAMAAIYAMLTSPNKDETAVHGCHCPGDMAVRMRKVLAIPRSCAV